MNVSNTRTQLPVGQEDARVLKKMRILGYVSRFFSSLLILLPAALGVLYVRKFGVSVVDSDA